MTEKIALQIEVKGQNELEATAKTVDKVTSAFKRLESNLENTVDSFRSSEESASRFEKNLQKLRQETALLVLTGNKSVASALAQADAYKKLSQTQIKELTKAISQRDIVLKQLKLEEQANKAHGHALVEDATRTTKQLEKLSTEHSKALLEDHLRKIKNIEKLESTHQQGLLEDHLRTTREIESLEKSHTNALIENKQREQKAIERLSTLQTQAILEDRNRAEKIAAPAVKVNSDIAILKEQQALIKQGYTAQEALTVAKQRAQGVSASLTQEYLKEQRALALLNQEATKIGTSLEVAGNKASFFNDKIRPILNFTIGLTIFSAITGGIAAFDDLLIRTEKVKIALQTVTGSAGAANARFDDLRKTAEELALPALQLAEGFTNFAIAAQGSALSSKEVETSFKQITKAAAGAGLQTEQFDGVMRALTQIMSKGKVQAEELRGQLGDRLPGAFTIAARAMNVTTAELDSMLKKGEVISEEFIPKFAAEMERIFGPAAEKRLNTFGGAIQNLKNAFAGLAIDSADELTGPLTAGLNFLADAVKLVGVVFLPLLKIVTSVIAAFAAYRIATLAAAAGNAILQVSMVAVGVASASSSTAILGLTATLAKLRVVMTFISTHPLLIAFTALAGIATYFYLEVSEAEARTERLNQEFTDTNKILGLLRENVDSIDLDKLVSNKDVQGLKNVKEEQEKLIAAGEAQVKNYEAQIRAKQDDAASMAAWAKAQSMGLASFDKLYEGFLKADPVYNNLIKLRQEEADKLQAVTLKQNTASLALSTFTNKVYDNAFAFDALDIAAGNYGTTLDEILGKKLDKGFDVPTLGPLAKPVAGSGSSKVDFGGYEDRLIAANKDLTEAYKDRLAVEKLVSKQLETNSSLYQEYIMVEVDNQRIQVKNTQTLEQYTEAEINRGLAMLSTAKAREKANSDEEAAAKKEQDSRNRSLAKLRELMLVNSLVLEQGMTIAQAEAEARKERLNLSKEQEAQYTSAAAANIKLREIEKTVTENVKQQTDALKELSKSYVELANKRETYAAVSAGASADEARELALIKAIKDAQAESTPSSRFESGGIDVKVEALNKELADLQLDRLIALTIEVNKFFEVSNQLKALDFTSVFGEGFGNPFEAAIGGIADLIDLQKKYNEEKVIAALANEDTAKLDQKYQQQQLKGIGTIISASKNFFKEKTGAYKALTQVEKAFRAFELAQNLKSLALQKDGILSGVRTFLEAEATKRGATIASTAFQVAQDGIKAASSAIVAAVSAMAGLPFPYNLAALAATVAAIGALGVSISSVSGSDSTGNTASQQQAVQGTGGVLGDPKAQTESIQNSLELLRDLGSDTLSINNNMLRALESIDYNIASMTDNLFRSNFTRTGSATGFNVQGSSGLTGLGNRQQRIAEAPLGSQQTLQTVNALGLGSSVVGQVAQLGADILNGVTRFVSGGLFGKQSQQQIDSGIQIATQNLGKIIEGSLDANFYGVIRTTTRSWFGRRRSDSTLTAELGSETENQLSLIFGGIADSISIALGAFGISAEEAKERLSNVLVDIGKISFQGLNAEDTNKAFAAVFGEFAASAVTQILPEIQQFQKAGEDTYETLIRVSAQTISFKEAAEDLGLTFPELSLAAVQAVDAIAAASGGFDALRTNLSAYYSEYFTEEERRVNMTKDLTRVVGELGVTMPTTRDGFKELINTLNLTDAADQQLFASLLQLAPAFDVVFDAVEEAAEEARKIKEEITKTEKELLTEIAALEGNVVDARREELMKLDESLVPLYDRIQALKEEAEVQKEALNIEKQILQELGDTVGLRALERGEIRTSNLERFDYLQSLKDEKVRLKEAEEEAKKLAEARQKEIELAKELSNRLLQLGGTIAAFLRSLKTNAEFVSPENRLANARSQFQNTLALAQGGDEKALGDITGIAQTLLDAGRDVFASGSGFQNILQQVETSLGALPAVRTYEEKQLELLNNILNGINSVAEGFDLLPAALQAVIVNTISSIKTLIQFVTDESGLPADIKSIILSTGNRFLKTVDFVTGSKLPDDLKELAVKTISGITKTVDFVVRTDLPEGLKRIAVLSTDNLSKTIDFVVRSDLSTDLKTIALSTTSVLSKIVDFTVRTDLPSDIKFLALRATDVLTKTVDLVAGAALPEDVKKIALTNTSKFTATVDAVLSSTLSNDIKRIVLTGSGLYSAVVSAAFNPNIDPKMRDLLITQTGGYSATVTAVIDGGLDPDIKELLLATDLEATKAVALSASFGGTLTEEQRKILFEQGSSVQKTVQGIVTAQIQNEAAGKILNEVGSTVRRIVDGVANGTVSSAEAGRILSQVQETVTKTVAGLANGGANSAEARAILNQVQQSVNKTVVGLANGGANSEEARKILNQLNESVGKNVLGYVGLGSSPSEDALAILRQQTQTLDKTIKGVVDTSNLTQEQKNILNAAGVGGTVRLSADVALNPDGSLKGSLDAIETNTGPTGSRTASDWLSVVNANLNNGIGFLAEYLRSMDTQLRNINENLFYANQKNTAQATPSSATAQPSRATTFALGGVFTNSIVSSPTMFDMGLMGEAGPEAIMPLSRGSDGSLGVRMMGASNDSGETVMELKQVNRNQAALIRLQQEANKQIIQKLSEMEERLAGMESTERLKAAA